MGLDGGTIPKRIEMVKTAKKPEKIDSSTQTYTQWHFCVLGKEPLQKPIASCRFGRLYNKENLIKYLINKKTFGDGEKICPHIKNLKNVVTLNLMDNPAKKNEMSSHTPNNSNQKISDFICPITQKEMNGHIK